jgi:hypothetical protein
MKNGADLSIRAVSQKRETLFNDRRVVADGYRRCLSVPDDCLQHLHRTGDGEHQR